MTTFNLKNLRLLAAGFYNLQAPTVKERMKMQMSIQQKAGRKEELGLGACGL